MATTEERMQILKMVESGQITAEEGAKLLAALNKVSEPSAGSPGSEPKWFRVRVTDLDTGRQKVSVNIPVGLVNVGIKMGARFAPETEGVDFGQIMEAIKSGTQGKVIDVVDEEDGERVEVFIE
ncbi:MAG: hypothetical protein NUW24_15320 [Anaerolineae bacterium]|jgi:hypothetical protein|nr:hypothetical protein [Anaerolineae bacterium]MDH7474923.1 hypothetical protein [Anaerolineae bacterium]